MLPDVLVVRLGPLVRQVGWLRRWLLHETLLPVLFVAFAAINNLFKLQVPAT